MGLKTIHIAFILFCLSFFGVTTWICIDAFRASGQWSLLFVAAVCVVSGAALVPYSFHFMKKLKDIGYM